MKRVHDGETEKADPSHGGPSHGGLGDLISNPTLGFWGSAGSASGFSPIERVLLSANGNLQRLVSSYLNAHVTVTVQHSTKKSHGVYEREVALLAQGQQFGVATSTVTLSREDCIDAVDRRGVAIGQMFRHLNIMPRFTLHSFGEQADGRFWREYTLEGSGVSCRITEQLSRAIFELPPPAPSPPPAAPPLAAPPPAAPDAAAPVAAAPDAAAPDAAAPSTAVGTGSFGDIMSVNTTGIELPSGFTAMQRLLLTANGNVERIVRAYYDEEVHMYVLESSRRAPGVHERKVVMHVRGEEIMQVHLARVTPAPLPLCFRCFPAVFSTPRQTSGTGYGHAWHLAGRREAPLPPSPTRPPAEHGVHADQARSMVFITDEAWLDATERQQACGWVGG